MRDAETYYRARERECNARRRMGALRDDVEATPVHLFPRGADPSKNTERIDPVNLLFARGDLPRDDDEAMGLINFAGKTGEKTLSKDDVYIHYVEAANGNFIGDRFMFLGDSTLKNIATHASDGFSFMNSHRTGGLSSPSELPFGQTFAGRYEEYAKPDGAVYRRSVLGLYMLRGVYPNGENGPSTDDLHKSIEGGTLSDVSMGLVYGSRVCDVCSQDLTAKDDDGKYLCPHAPGTHRKMSDEQKGIQEKRGVKGGRASYSLVDAMPQEVSAVYKGAVPGAGFRKARQFALSGDFTADEGRELLSAYGPLWGNRERSKLSRGESRTMKLRDIFQFWNAIGRPNQLAIEGGQLSIEGLGGVDMDDLADRDDVMEDRVRSTGTAVPARVRAGQYLSTAPAREVDPQVAEGLRVADERNRKAAEREARVDAREFLATHRAAGRCNKTLSERFEAAFVVATLDDERSPIEGFSRVGALKHLIESRPKSALMDDSGGGDLVGDDDVALRPGEKALNNGPDNSPPGDVATQERRFALHSHSPQGLEFLRSIPEGREWLKRNGKS